MRLNKNLFFFHRRFCWLALITVLGVPVVLGGTGPAWAESADLRVMSFNVRFSHGVPQEDAAENDWNDLNHPRRERAVQVVREFKPDLLGLQEALTLQVDDLSSALPELSFYGAGRDDGKQSGEFSGVFYRTERFELTDAGTFWLSETPEEPGTTFSKLPRALPRIASWVRLRDKQADQEIVVLNTHFDHVSDPARRQSAELIRQRITSLANGAPAIVMGDLNTTEDSPAYRALVRFPVNSEPRLIDSYRTVHRQRTSDEATFNHWKGTIEGSRIDFILHTPEFTATEASIVRTNYDGLWPSDHYPVTAILRLKE